MEQVRVKLVDELSGNQVAIVMLTRLPVAGDRVVVNQDGIARLLVVKVVAHVPPRKGSELHGVAVVVEKRAASHKGGDVVPFLSLVPDRDGLMSEDE